MAWSLEHVANPTLLIVHVTGELTSRTIETFPPGDPSPPLHQVMGLPGISRVDLHRYRARLTVTPGHARDTVATAVMTALTSAWGKAVPVPPVTLPRAFEVDYQGPRLVAESMEMAGDRALLVAAFRVPGVTEAIVGPSMALVRLGRLFTWAEAEAPLAAALREAV